ncbi:hypothetical protein CPB84DRAFT_1678207 [Gymnopilus junonius]|uniref:Uncharacterized protein n=1 Tax=Gymnopilus junonius TaxID=109634 RepID=A0A9P5NSR5_GYMJU|nr:hypothetical protein CPB84DRAFT_1678207 [Gymnopilus junonius]
MVNKSGKNQYKNCPPRNCPETAKVLRDYHRRGLTNADEIASLFAAEHSELGTLSARSVARRKSDLGLTGSGLTTKNLPLTVKRQLVLDQMNLDPLSRKGPNTIRENILNKTGTSLTRDFVRDEMRLHDPDGFELREPTAKKVHREQLTALGPHHEWSADGHDKLSTIGFPIWAARDKWGSQWLGLWVLPNNRWKLAIGFLYLNLIYILGGMPFQSTTDCGSETITMFGLAVALREIFFPAVPHEELPAHRFLRSVHNITIERGWKRLRLQWGDNIKAFYLAGVAAYNSNDVDQYNLHEWLWPKFIQQDLDALRDEYNNHKTRYDKNKLLPSGVSPNVAMALYPQYGVESYLIPVDRNVILKLMADIGGEDLIRFVSREFEERAEVVYAFLGCPPLAADTIWPLFWKMLPFIRNAPDVNS